MTRIVMLDDADNAAAKNDPSLKTELSLKGEPYLLVSTTSQYYPLYDDKGSGADMDVTLFRPTPSDPACFIVGDYAQGNYNPAAGTSLIVKAINDDPDLPMLKAPLDYVLVWSDKGTGARSDGSIWHPVPPDGYVVLGSVAQTGYDKPVIDNYRCLRQDLAVATQAANKIWSDRGSGGNMDVTLWGIVGDMGLFKAQGNYHPPVADFLKISGS